MELQGCIHAFSKGTTQRQTGLLAPKDGDKAGTTK
jgi:hypothetical protein